MHHIKQILLVTFCDTTARIGANFQTHKQTDDQTNGWMDRQKWKLNRYLGHDQAMGFIFCMFHENIWDFSISLLWARVKFFIYT